MFPVQARDYLKAKRLLLQPLQPEDAEQAQLLFPQWEITAEEWRSKRDELCRAAPTPKKP